MTVFKGLLKNRGYLTLMLAQAISSIGDWLSIVAVITLVGLKWHASPIEVSLIFLCLAIPMAVLGPKDQRDRFTIPIQSSQSGPMVCLTLYEPKCVQDLNLSNIFNLEKHFHIIFFISFF